MKIAFYNFLRNNNQNTFTTILHPISQLGKVYLTILFAILSKIFLENNAQIFVIAEDFIEGMAHDEDSNEMFSKNPFRD
jgi:hypothetical protein